MSSKVTHHLKELSFAFEMGLSVLDAWLMKSPAEMIPVNTWPPQELLDYYIYCDKGGLGERANDGQKNKVWFFWLVIITRFFILV